MTEEQRRALALANARRRMAEAQAAPAGASGMSNEQQLAEGLIPSGDTDTSAAPAVMTAGGGTGLDQTRTLAAPMLDTAGQAFRGATGQSPSIVGGILEGGVNLGYGDDVQVPRWLAQTIGRPADLMLSGLSLVGGVGSGAAGLVGDTAEALGVPGADRLGRELAAMPEAFAGSPAQFAGMVPRGGPNIARAGALPDAPVAPAPPAPSVGSSARAATRPSPATPPPPPAADPATVGSRVRAAAQGNRRAQRDLASEVQVDPEAAAAADRLGIEVPVDVLSNNQLIRESAGLTRSIAGTPASAGWRDTIINAAEKATEAMRAIGGDVDLSRVSSNVLNTLGERRAGLKQQASKLYDAVDDAVTPGTIVEPNNTVRALNEILGELGGEKGMTAAERSLFELATGDQPVTYERLMREKRAVQRALRGGGGMYADADDRILRRVERALVLDQLDNVTRIGGDGLRGNLELANRLTAQQKGLEESIIGAFGRDGEGSIANTLRSAVTSASKGDVGNLNRVLNVIPEELRGEAVASAIMSAAQSNRAAEPGFGFAEFAKTYRGLRANSDVYKRIVDTLGPDADRTMRDLYEISRRITDARANVLTTGKANQALLQGMTAEGLLTRVLNTSMGRNAVRATTTGAGAMVGGPMGAGAAASTAETVMKALTNRGANQLEQAGALFSSPDFQRLATAAATGAPTSAAQKAVVASKPFQEWAAAARVENPVQWLEAALLASSNAQPESAE